MRVYRQDSHLRPLVFWAALGSFIAFVVFTRSRALADRMTPTEILVILALLVFPLALLIYLIRDLLVRVSVDVAQGIHLPGGKLIPWESIERFEWRKPLLRSTSGPSRRQKMDWEEEGRIVPWGVLVFLWLIRFVLYPVLVIPLLEVFTPVGDRLRIVTRDGDFVLRDLREPDEFVRAVRQRRPVVEV